MKKNWIASFALITLLGACKPSTPAAEQPVAATEETVETTAPAEVTADERGYIVKVGDMAPDFTMKLTDGKEVKLSDLRGKVVMLQFTASWCGVCIREMPFIEKDIWLKHQSNPKFALFGIDRDEPLEKIEELIKKTGVTYPIGFDPNGDIFALYAERKAGITRNVIIDETGRIVMLTRKFEQAEFDEMVRKIDSMLE